MGLPLHTSTAGQDLSPKPSQSFPNTRHFRPVVYDPQARTSEPRTITIPSLPLRRRRQHLRIDRAARSRSCAPSPTSFSSISSEAVSITEEGSDTDSYASAEVYQLPYSPASTATFSAGSDDESESETDMHQKSPTQGVPTKDHSDTGASKHLTTLVTLHLLNRLEKLDHMTTGDQIKASEQNISRSFGAHNLSTRLRAQNDAFAQEARVLKRKYARKGDKAAFELGRQASLARMWEVIESLEQELNRA